jgi:hypothetical protein
MRDVIFAKCNYDKMPSRRMLLTIEREQTGTFVYKRGYNAQAADYLRSVLDHERLVADYIGDRAHVVVGQLNADGRVRYPFVQGPTLQYVLAEYLDTERTERAYRLMNDAVDWMRTLDSSRVDPRSNTNLRELYGDPLPYEGEVECLTLGLLDLNGQNILHDPGGQRYTLIDHELVIPGPVPLELTIFRFVLFTLLPFRQVLELHAELQPMRSLCRGELRIPASWDFSAWLDESRLERLIELEERLQARFTGRAERWPRDDRPIITNRYPPNMHQSISALALKFQACQDRLAELEATRAASRPPSKKKL